jgi:hypothetical protein
MALSNTITAAVKTAMNAIGDLKTPITYTRVEPGNYDPATDTTLDVTQAYPIEAPIVGLTEDEMAWIATDKKGAKLLIAAADLPVVPLITDYVLIDGARWEVVKIKRVPGNSLWILVIQGT